MRLFSHFIIYYISTRENEKTYKKLFEEAVNLIWHVLGDIEDEKSPQKVLLNGRFTA